jgi:membrane associated rhomboid family serine protease
VFPIRDDVPSSRAPLGTWVLIAANVAVFVLLLGLSPREYERFVMEYAFIPARYTNWSWAERAGLPAWDLRPLGASMFLHAGWLHLILNLWMLWIFGDNVEDRMGTWRFLLFYGLCGVVAIVVHGALAPGSKIPALGASGAIAGVLGAYLLLFPRARVLVLVPIVIIPLFFEVPAWVYLALWFAFQIMSGTTALAEGQQAAGVAWWAHIGGFGAGVLLHRRFVVRRSRVSQVL